eukprot:6143512-Alexandrium_andersonii.AAC.1
MRGSLSPGHAFAAPDYSGEVSGPFAMRVLDCPVSFLTMLDADCPARAAPSVASSPSCAGH